MLFLSEKNLWLCVMNWTVYISISFCIKAKKKKNIIKWTTSKKKVGRKKNTVKHQKANDSTNKPGDIRRKKITCGDAH